VGLLSWPFQPEGEPMQCQQCQAAAVIHISDFSRRALVGERHLCEDHCRQFYDTHPTPAQGPRWRRPREGIVTAHAVEGIASNRRPRPLAASPGEVEVDVGRLDISEWHEQQVVFLREVAGVRLFHILIGVFEAAGIDRMLRGLPAPRPLTHDAWAATIAALGGEVQDVLVSDLREDTYFAEVRIRQAGRLVPVDVRPSDAFVLACKCGVPIRVAEKVLAAVCD
jgi:bifunctional DNase/RNase